MLVHLRVEQVAEEGDECRVQQHQAYHAQVLQGEAAAAGGAQAPKGVIRGC